MFCEEAQSKQTCETSWVEHFVGWGCFLCLHPVSIYMCPPDAKLSRSAKRSTESAEYEIIGRPLDIFFVVKAAAGR
jgi:hypothetical protein